MEVAIRVDSSAQIGSGHLMRCLTLAEKRKQQGDRVVFVCRDLEGNLAQLVQDKGYELLLLPRAEENKELTGYAAWLTVSQERDAAETIAALQSRKLGAEQGRLADMLVIDSYAIDIAWESRLRPYVQEIFVIDDLANRQHDCDTLLEQNFKTDGQHRYDGLVPPNCKMLLGPKYALLRQEFYETRKKMSRHRDRIRNILVFYGGSDLTNETAKAVEALLALRDRMQHGKNGEAANGKTYTAGCLDMDFTADVIVGGSNRHGGEIKRLCQGKSFIHLHGQVDNMAELMAQADLALGAGGATTWERCFMGLPAIVTAIADNQLEGCQDCSQAGLIEYIGTAENVTAEKLQEAILLMTQEKLRMYQISGERLMGMAQA